MDKSFYREEIQAAYLGEIIGAAAFGAIAENPRLSPEQREVMQKLARLEILTRACLGPVMRRHNIAVENVEAIEAGTRAAASQADDWSAVLQSVQTDTLPYIARFEALLEAAEPEDAAALRLLLEHEQALQQFAVLELAGRREEAVHQLDRALGQLSIVASVTS